MKRLLSKIFIAIIRISSFLGISLSFLYRVIGKPKKRRIRDEYLS